MIQPPIERTDRHTPVPAVTSRRWDEPDGTEARGTVLVLAGRGETPATYTRLGRRLSADAYRVRAVGDVTAPRQRSLALAKNLLREEHVAPLVLAGQDAGAIAALRLATSFPERVDGVIVAGLPGHREGVPPGIPQLPLRTRSPEHWAQLSDPAVIEPEGLSREIPEHLELPDPVSVTVPVLALHGAEDRVAPLDEVADYYAGIPDALLAVIDRGLHDSLNDASHRSVAATIVLFLEELRNGTPTVGRWEAKETGRS